MHDLNISVASLCSWSRGTVRLHRAESDCDFGPLLLGALSRIRPAECHPWSPGGAAKSLGVHQDGGSRFWIGARGLTALFWGWRLCHLGRNELHVTVLFLLEPTTTLPSCPAARPQNKAPTLDCYPWSYWPTCLEKCWYVLEKYICDTTQFTQWCSFFFNLHFRGFMFTSIHFWIALIPIFCDLQYIFYISCLRV